MTKLVMDLARQSFEVGGLALSRNVGRSDDDIVRTEKPAINKLGLLASSFQRSRSLIHCRFNTRGLSNLILESSADVFVAEHSYMAEPFLDVRLNEAPQKLLINSHVSESEVWKLTKPPLLHFEHKRIAGDESRVAQIAKSVAYFDKKEALESPADNSYWLNLTLPPGRFIDRSRTAKRLVFLGDRTWPPNAQAAEKALKLWPAIARGIRDAELVLVGKPGPGTRRMSLPAGVRDASFVPDLSELLDSARALIAPVSAGGGVRVKILEAARAGLPVVGTPQALGSLGDVLPISEFADDEQLVRAARNYLLDANDAGIAGSALFEVNKDRWSQNIPQIIVHDWLVGK